MSVHNYSIAKSLMLVYCNVISTSKDNFNIQHNKVLCYSSNVVCIVEAVIVQSSDQVAPGAFRLNP